MKEIIGIIGAMKVEVSTLCQKLEKKEILNFAGLEFNHGFLNSKEVVIGILHYHADGEHPTGGRTAHPQPKGRYGTGVCKESWYADHG